MIQQKCSTGGGRQYYAVSIEDFRTFDGGSLIWKHKESRLLISLKSSSVEGSASVITVRPQITFQLPLSLMRKFIHSLNTRFPALAPEMMGEMTYDHAGDAEKAASDLSEARGPFAKAVWRRALDISQAKTAFFSELMLRYLRSESLSVVSANTILDGLCLLYLTYVYQLFVMNNPVFINETGPKAFTKLMSRYAFSDMYSNLNIDEQGQFLVFAYVHGASLHGKELFERPIKQYKRDDPLLCFESSTDKKGDPISDLERISLLDWLNSIHTPIVRGPDTPGKDLLAPPPHTTRNYSMGAIKVEKVRPKHALIEVRGYGNLRLPGDTKPTLDNFKSLLDNESVYFFGLEG